MKIRNGFVSNSSTSSFIIYGTTIEKGKFVDKFKTSMTEDELELAMAKYVEKSPWMSDEFKAKDWKQQFDSGIDNEGIYFIEEIMDKSDIFKGVTIQTGSEYDDYVYIGVHPSNLKDDETGAEFKKRVKDTIKNIIGVDCIPNYIIEAWRDG